MGTIFAVVGSNLMVAYFEEKMFTIVPQIYLKKTLLNFSFAAIFDF